MDKVREKSLPGIKLRSFLTVVILLVAAILVSSILSYCIPQGRFLRDENGAIIPGTFVKGEIQGIAIWRIISAPFRVFASDDALTVIMISLFILIITGVFNILDKTNGTKIFIGKLIHKLANVGGLVVCI